MRIDWDRINILLLDPPFRTTDLMLAFVHLKSPPLSSAREMGETLNALSFSTRLLSMLPKRNLLWFPRILSLPSLQPGG